MLTGGDGRGSSARGYTLVDDAGESAMAMGDRTSHGRPWDADADAALHSLITEGALLPAIARTLGRTQEAVRSRANIMKLPVRSSPGRGRRVLAVRDA